MKEGRRTRPPAEYREQMRQYTQGSLAQRKTAKTTPPPPGGSNDSDNGKMTLPSSGR